MASGAAGSGTVGHLRAGEATGPRIGPRRHPQRLRKLKTPDEEAADNQAVTDPGRPLMRRANMSRTKSRIAEIRSKLDLRRAALLEEVRDALEQSENQQYIALIDGAPTDFADESIGDALADLSLAIIDRHVREIRDIEAARARLDGGEYGICADCGEEIVIKRLLATPTVTRCLACQTQRERVYAHEGTPTL